jgi:1,5-anhydro-D-fructose reductase (1,5-anhydro-D-mannitol-forming)
MTIRWALVGTGRHAERSVVGGLKRASGAALVAVVSRALETGRVFAERHGIARVHQSFEEMLRDPGIDAIYDTTPDGLHAGHAMAAAAAGKHMLLEKPLAISVASGAEAVEAARRHRVKLGVVFNQRHEAVHVEARRLVAAGAIGDVVAAHVRIPLRVAASSSSPPRETTWRTDPAYRPGGIGWSIGDHAFDTLAYLTGQAIEEVSAFTDATRCDPPNERTAGLLLRLANGAIGHAAASSRTPYAKRPFEVHGTKGSIVVENSFVRTLPVSDCFRLEVEQMGRAIEGNGEPMTPGAEGLRSVAIGEAVFASVRERRAVTVADRLLRP